jgi:hypothetical protein
MDASTKGLLWVSAVFVAVWLALRYIILRQPIKQSPTYLKAYTGIVGVGWTVGQVIARELFNHLRWQRIRLGCYRVLSSRRNLGRKGQRNILEIKADMLAHCKARTHW